MNLSSKQEYPIGEQPIHAGLPTQRRHAILRAGMSNSPEPKHSKPLAAISLIIAVIALAAFVILSRKMAPPYPKTQGTTNSPTATNAPH